MRKQQLALIGAAAVLFVLILSFGKFIPPKSPAPAAQMPAQPAMQTLSAKDVIAAAKSRLTPAEQERITLLEKDAAAGDAKNRQTEAYRQLAKFWNDSAHYPQLSAYYEGEAAKLENSEQSINFAARKLLSYVMAEQNQPMQTWMATDARELFEQALKINPADDSAQVGLSGCYMFGNISGNPMQEILKLREIAEKNPDNLYAQMMLGLGGMQSGQYENAAKRFQIVVEKQPANLEAILNLADAYEGMGDKQNAIKWYKVAKDLVQIPEVKREIAKRIISLEN